MAEKTGMSRRAFVGLGTTALAAAGMGLAGCAAQPNNAGAKDEPSEETTWRTAPEPIADSEIAETITADVVVVGAGHAGTAATRALAEAGVSVVCIEEQSEENFMMIGNDIGHINSEYLASQGVPKVDEQEFFHNWMVNSGHRANADLVMKFTKNCGQAFDWWLEPLSDEQIASINVDFWPETEHTLHELNTGLKYWIGTPQLYGQVNGESFDMTAAYKIIHEHIKTFGNAQIAYGNSAEQLVINDAGAVEGVVALREDGTYAKYMAGKGVLLAAGDFSANQEMAEDLLQSQFEALEGEEAASFQGMGRTGRGIQMGVWAGGRMEPSPLPLVGDFESSVPSKYAALWLDQDGKRYCNECAGDYVSTGYSNVRHKHGTRYIVFDSTIIEALAYNVPAHAAFDPTEEGALESFQETLDQAYAAGDEGYAPEDPHGGKQNPTYAADDMETLANRIGLSGEAKENFLAAVERYNEVCAAGVDDDYGKDPRLLFPVANPPFYAVVASTGRLGTVLVTNGGLETNADQQVLGDTRDPIEGLYATGNCCGLRFGPAYFTPVAGVSIGMAITLGREAGKTLAAL